MLTFTFSQLAIIGILIFGIIPIRGVPIGNDRSGTAYSKHALPITQNAAGLKDSQAFADTATYVTPSSSMMINSTNPYHYQDADDVPNPRSELALMLPEFFRFMESMMIIMSNAMLRQRYPDLPESILQTYPTNFDPSYPPIGTSTRPGSSPTAKFSASGNKNNSNSNPFHQLNFSNFPFENYFSNAKKDIEARVSHSNGKDALSLSPPDEDEDQPALKSLHAANHFNKFCLFQGISPLTPTDCQKYLVCFPVKYNRFQAFIAECPEDKKFSQLYRRCVQPYLVPECSGFWYLRPPPPPPPSPKGQSQSPIAQDPKDDVEVFDPKRRQDKPDKPLVRPIKGLGKENENSVSPKKAELVFAPSRSTTPPTISTPLEEKYPDLIFARNKEMTMTTSKPQNVYVPPETFPGPSAPTSTLPLAETTYATFSTTTSTSTHASQIDSPVAVAEPSYPQNSTTTTDPSPEEIQSTSTNNYSPSESSTDGPVKVDLEEKYTTEPPSASPVHQISASHTTRTGDVDVDVAPAYERESGIEDKSGKMDESPANEEIPSTDKIEIEPESIGRTHSDVGEHKHERISKYQDKHDPIPGHDDYDYDYVISIGNPIKNTPYKFPPE